MNDNAHPDTGGARKGPKPTQTNSNLFFNQLCGGNDLIVCFHFTHSAAKQHTREAVVVVVVAGVKKLLQPLYTA